MAKKPKAKKKSALQQILDDIQKEVTSRIESLRNHMEEHPKRLQEAEERWEHIKKQFEYNKQLHKEALKEFNAANKRYIQSCQTQIDEQKARIALAIASAKVIEPLTKLKTSKAVAKFLKDLKIKGVVGRSTKCPLAAYLNKNGPKGASGKVDSYSIVLDGIDFPHTKATQQFVTDFDSDRYPELEKPEWTY
jgi:archaellum component FlaC